MWAFLPLLTHSTDNLTRTTGSFPPGATPEHGTVIALLWYCVRRPRWGNLSSCLSEMYSVDCRMVKNSTLTTQELYYTQQQPTLLQAQGEVLLFHYGLMFRDYYPSAPYLFHDFQSACFILTRNVALSSSSGWLHNEKVLCDLLKDMSVQYT